MRSAHERVGVQRADVAVDWMPLREANAIVTAHHYLHRPRPAGTAQRIIYRGVPAGVFIWARPMVSGVCCGFEPKAIIELARMYLTDNQPNLATASFRRGLAMIRQKYPLVRAVVSWCDRTRFDGAFYRAAGFKLHGMARLRSLEASSKRHGGGRRGRVTQEDRLHPKDRYLLTLREDGNANE